MWYVVILIEIQIRGWQIKLVCCRNENILKADVGQQVGVSINDCRIYHDGSIVQELRYPYLELKFTLTEIRRWCVTCDREFDSSVDGDSHKTHITEMLHGETVFVLGWGHLEAKLHSCFMNVCNSY